MVDKVIPFTIVKRGDKPSVETVEEEHTTVQMLHKALEIEWENVCVIGIKKDSKEIHVFPDKNLYLGDLHLLLAKVQALIVTGQFDYLD